MVENKSEKNCTNIFMHDSEELSEAFTKLWVQMINKKEAKQNQISAANVNGLELPASGQAFINS